ncbi:phosphoglycerol transferase MdoB-like AlkP superfamily enzyme [Pseudomonas koreensis]|uniref:LTA synthase family protein n=1 Tax=Pseudomonas koreensis TaxID=198620 RepID=UPI002864C056|nr:LTA synthase family protein [Pseudomonas koreensis]MDR7057682.1 phosphoglycerol transferase MdoB-like AlkP superfamily enzyme [Pseudomonas koreensis]
MSALFNWLRRPNARLLSLIVLVLIVPVCLRAALGWSTPLGFLSDLAVGSLLVVALHRRAWWQALPVLVFWALLAIATAELVSAVGRLPTPSDIHYLIDPQFVENSTGGGLAHPALTIALLGALVFWLVTQFVGRGLSRPALPRFVWVAPIVLFAAHWGTQNLWPNDGDAWRLYNLPHQLLASEVADLQIQAEEWLDGDIEEPTPAMAGLTDVDLIGQKLLAAPGQARNVLIIALEGIPGAYIRANREAIGSHYQEDLMPNLSRWAERGMNTPDYVLHTHQTIRGLYAMLCGDYDKLNNGTPKGVEMLTLTERNQACLPAQLREHGFSTHYLQGAGLRFMAKDKIMPHIGFDATHGLEWFSNSNYLEFPWGKDDKAFFEGALDYVGQLKKHKQPWMLTLLTVGTHQPYSAPEDYLQRYETPKQAAVGYLDDALDQFLSGLERQGVLNDTLVVITSDESHGIDGVRLASSWGFNLTLAPEQAQLPRLNAGVYGHVDLSTSILDYFDLPVPTALSGRSLFRDYDSGREIMSFTNGKLRYHNGQGIFSECDLPRRCRYYQSAGFIAESATYKGTYSGHPARQIAARADALDLSLLRTPLNHRYQFGSNNIIPLQAQIKDDWADNLIGAQYLEMPKGSHTRVRLTVRSVDPQQAAYIQLKAKQFEQDVQLGLPTEMVATADQPLELDFSFKNPQPRKAFSFHLLGYGNGAVEVSDFSVITELPGQDDILDDVPDDETAQSS